MIPRIAKIALIAGVAFFLSLIVFNNLTDFDSNYQFVRHVLMMDSTFPGNHGMWRAIDSPAIHVAFYLGIIAWEIATAILLWWGAARMFRALRSSADSFAVASRLSAYALTLSLLMWLVAFLAAGGEWFLMWQSRLWNGQEAAFRNFAVVGLVLLIVSQPEEETQP
jgi:predicted small integral membrane protein